MIEGRRRDKPGFATAGFVLGVLCASSLVALAALPRDQSWTSWYQTVVPVLLVVAAISGTAGVVVNKLAFSAQPDRRGMSAVGLFLSLGGPFAALVVLVMIQSIDISM